MSNRSSIFHVSKLGFLNTVSYKCAAVQTTLKGQDIDASHIRIHELEELPECTKEQLHQEKVKRDYTQGQLTLPTLDMPSTLLTPDISAAPHLVMLFP
jgi:hypothetical protein